MENFSTRDTIVEVVNKLFIYTDEQAWNKIEQEVFTAQVAFDMSSLDGENATKAAGEICEIWRTGFTGIDAVNHLAGNYLVEITGDTATVFAYATATHYRKLATNGKTREFVGTYNLHLTNSPAGWRIDSFKYNLKFATGNTDFT